MGDMRSGLALLGITMGMRLMLVGQDGTESGNDIQNSLSQVG
jgi:hypothetical protein